MHWLRTLLTLQNHNSYIVLHVLSNKFNYNKKLKNRSMFQWKIFRIFIFLFNRIWMIFNKTWRVIKHKNPISNKSFSFFVIVAKT